MTELSELPTPSNSSTPSDASTVRSVLDGIDPFNLRLTRRPLRCVTGLSIPPGLVGFCWETPLCFEVLQQQAPDLALVVERWKAGQETGTLARQRGAAHVGIK